MSNKIKALAIGLSGSSLALFGAMLAHADTVTPDAAVASTATTVSSSLQANLVSGLTTVVPIMVAVGVIFWVVRFAYKKIAGKAH